jgi:hypothetical protein
MLKAGAFALLLLILPGVVVSQPLDLSTLRFWQDKADAMHGGLRAYHIKDGKDYLYVRPPNSRYYNFLIKDYPAYARITFRKDKLPAIGAMVAGTALLMVFDEQLIEGAQNLGDNLGLKHTEHQKSVVHWSIKFNGKIIKVPLNFPQDAATGLYFLGDGILHSSIALGMWGYGKIAHDSRAVQTGTQLIEAILCTGVTEQILKHTAGREDPNSATVRGGKWTLFPNPVDYQFNTPHYDAMPSGHIATAMATVTVIADNYPEKRWIRPTGYSLMGVLMFAMMNNGVHWASDFPLGISIGYTFAKICDGRAMTFLRPKGSPEHALIKSTQLTPYFAGDGLGVRMTLGL